MSKRQELIDTYGPLVFLSEEYFDEAILGTVTRKGVTSVVYDEGACIEAFMNAQGSPRGEAVEYLDFNTFSAHVTGGPLFLERWA